MRRVASRRTQDFIMTNHETLTVKNTFYRKYVERKGDARVSRSHKEGELRLARWVYKQRSSKSKGKLSEDRIQRLEALPGWYWSGMGGTR